ncbi:MAG: hypothetical protein ACN6PL_13810, partial [Pseudomonas putida]
ARCAITLRGQAREGLQSSPNNAGQFLLSEVFAYCRLWVGLLLLLFGLYLGNLLFLLGRVIAPQASLLCQEVLLELFSPLGSVFSMHGAGQAKQHTTYRDGFYQFHDAPRFPCRLACVGLSPACLGNGLATWAQWAMPVRFQWQRAARQAARMPASMAGLPAGALLSVLVFMMPAPAVSNLKCFDGFSFSPKQCSENTTAVVQLGWCNSCGATAVVSTA